MIVWEQWLLFITMLSYEVPMNMAARRASSDRADVLRVPPTAPLGPVHKRAFGGAVGIVCGLAVFALTLFHIVFQPVDAPDIGLLAQYFYRYEVSWKGAFIGLFWGFVTGYVAGWFIAFVRNLAIAIRVFTLRSKAELAQIKDFLDHI